MDKSDIEDLQKFLSRGAPLSTPETFLRRAIARIDVEKSPKREQYATLLVTITDSEKPVAGVEILLRNEKGNLLEWDGVRRTTQEGRGFITLPLWIAKNKPVLELIISRNQKEAIIFKQLISSTSGKSEHLLDSYTLRMEWLTDSTELPVVKSENRVRRFNIAIASDVKNLDEPIELINRHDCFHLKQVLIEGSKPKDMTLPKSIPITTIGKNVEASLTAIDVVLDFSESEYLHKLWCSQVQGDRRVPALIIPVRQFLGRIEQLEGLLPVDNGYRNQGE